MKFGNHLDFADDIPIELLEIRCWYPIFLVKRTPYLVNGVETKKACPDVKARHIAGVPPLCSPVPCDMGGMILMEDWVKDRLPEQQRRERRIPLFPDQSEFVRPYRAIQHSCFIHTTRVVFLFLHVYVLPLRRRLSEAVLGRTAVLFSPLDSSLRVRVTPI